VHSLTRAFQLSVELAQRALGGLALALGEVLGNADHTLLLPRRVHNRDLLDGQPANAVGGDEDPRGPGIFPQLRGSRRWRAASECSPHSGGARLSLEAPTLRLCALPDPLVEFSPSGWRGVWQRRARHWPTKALFEEAKAARNVFPLVEVQRRAESSEYRQSGFAQFVGRRQRRGRIGSQQVEVA
jgi:hypothetical protein